MIHTSISLLLKFTSYEEDWKCTTGQRLNHHHQGCEGKIDHRWRIKVSSLVKQGVLTFSFHPSFFLSFFLGSEVWEQIEGFCSVGIRWFHDGNTSTVTGLALGLREKYRMVKGLIMRFRDAVKQCLGIPLCFVPCCLFFSYLFFFPLRFFYFSYYFCFYLEKSEMDLKT